MEKAEYLGNEGCPQRDSTECKGYVGAQSIGHPNTFAMRYRRALFGTLTGVSPPMVSVGDTVLMEGLYKNARMPVRDEDIGRTVALIPCETGFLILFFV